jgi:hypothetical protein
MNNNATTPQRPQPKRRQRHQTISSESPKLLHPVQSASSLRVQPPQQQRRTPQNNRNGGQKLQRQHSVSCCTPTTGKLTPPQFMRLQKATGGSQSSLFSGSKFLDSPAPETVPLPPSHWFSTNVADLVPARVRTSPTPSSASDSLSSASSIESSSSDELLSSGFEQRGFRVNPMTLIAAVSAVV